MRQIESKWSFFVQKVIFIELDVLELLYKRNRSAVYLNYGVVFFDIVDTDTLLILLFVMK